MERRERTVLKRKERILKTHFADCNEKSKFVHRAIYADIEPQKEKHYGSVHNAKDLQKRKSVLFSQLAANWLMNIKSGVKESTYTRYHRSVYSYLIPAWENRKIFEIDTLAVNQFKEKLLACGGKRGNGLSEKTVADILSVLKQIISYADGEGYYVMNTCLIRNPRQKKKDIFVIHKKQLERLEEILLLSEDNISLGILLTLHTGIRNGELCGLRWGDFNFVTKTLSIRRTVERIANLNPNADTKTKIVVTDPKSESSKREIPLPKALCNYLKTKRGAADTYLLTGTEKPSEPHTLYVRYERFLKRNGFVGYSFHALRHTFATRGIEAGIDPKLLSEILGHSDVTTTLRCYVHPSIEQKRKQMEELFDNKSRARKYDIGQ